ncbi:hypothetical protein JRG19_00400 [Pseudoclavibacter alba]|uniref:Uncharacterized protein n=1 Tax=Pseudoclavibacter albus TaxID=272241 RepID=A0ABT2HY02_9MICO|nr:hypothetical protein [Pseudoclavibacter alba]MBN6777013.1 hypothetical protein [Pseudoclavibacter alba]MCT2043204.1 hypothetical protein [Pseudoclavibacter alba]
MSPTKRLSNLTHVLVALTLALLLQKEKSSKTLLAYSLTLSLAASWLSDLIVERRLER